MFKHKQSKLPRRPPLTNREFGYILEAFEREVPTEVQLQLRDWLNAIRGGVGWPVRADKEKSDIKTMRGIARASDRLLKHLGVKGKSGKESIPAEIRTDLFVASLVRRSKKEPDVMEFLASVTSGADSAFSEKLNQIAKAISYVGRLANTAAELAKKTQKRSGPDEDEFNDLIKVFGYVYCVVTRSKPKTKEEMNALGRVLGALCEVFGMPENKRSASKVLSRYRTSRRQIEALADRVFEMDAARANLCDTTQADFDALVARLRAGEDDVKAQIIRIMHAGLPLDFSQVEVKEHFKLEKFEGNKQLGQEPFEVIEGGDDRPTVVRRS